ncbi:MAG: GDP-mannose 4,6-dehydratase [Coxiellaceae bacterium]|nr:GDP-mannose 4,6-dehydratase [Coxiellaceae bacterium]
MNILITGAGGMVGSHMLDKFSADYNVIGTYHDATVSSTELNKSAKLIPCDIRNADEIYKIILKYLPAKIFHLAAQSYPVVSWSKPLETMEINAGGTINVFEAIKKINGQKLYEPVVVVACSSAEYGASMRGEPVDETTELLPLHPYGVSKVAQDLLTYQYYINDGIKGIRARIFNTTGPRKTNDVVSDFAKRAVKIVNSKQEQPLMVGNLDTHRAILDVSDLVDALWLLSGQGKGGEAYNICSEHTYQIRQVVTYLEEVLGQKFKIKQDPALMRKSDEPIIWGSTEKLKGHTGWQQSVDINTTLYNVIKYAEMTCSETGSGAIVQI